VAWIFRLADRVADVGSLGGAGSKPPLAAVVKSHGREHRRKRPGNTPGQVAPELRRGFCLFASHLGKKPNLATMRLSFKLWCAKNMKGCWLHTLMPLAKSAMPEG
jgi:hypothetical protein